ncbi:MAG: DUF4402 domain-containing protein [Balneolaceae bacterium]|nr:MAG: DUF4402 domain-containing protein [Balneolaceae bacterium]
MESALEVVNLPGVLNLDFGSVLPGASESITHGSGVDFQILGADNANVVVSFTAPTQLTGPGGSIAFTPDFQGSSSNDPASANPVANGGTRALNGDGHHFLWLGGSITVGNILPGIYDAAFTVSVAY